MRRQDAANLPLRGRQCAAHPHRKVVGAQSLGHQACEAKRTAQSQGRRGSKACRHSAPDVDRAHRIQMVVKGGCQSTCIVGRRLPADQISGNERPCRDAGVGEIALGLAMLKTASSNAIMRRARPYCGRTLNPARMSGLTPRPELENDQDPKRTLVAASRKPDPRLLGLSPSSAWLVILVSHAIDRRNEGGSSDAGSELFEKGLKTRKQVLGAKYVDANLAGSDDFMMTFQRAVTELAWGYAWSSPRT